jgi:hypothetical protein
MLTTSNTAKACYDEQLVDGGSRRVRGNSASSSLSTMTTNGGEQQIPSSNGLIVEWASLPDHALSEILKQLRWERNASGAFRSVCKGWREAHDSMVPSIKLAVPFSAVSPRRPSLPYRFRTGFTGVKKLNLSSFGGSMRSKLLSSVIVSFPGLKSLNLADNKMCHELNAWAPSLTGLTYLSMARTNVRDRELAVLAPFLSSLIYLDLNECAGITFQHLYSPPLEASLKALTHLNLSFTKVGVEGMRTLASLAALAHLELEHIAVYAQGVRLLAPLAAHLTHLALGGEDLGDVELRAVSFLTELTSLEIHDHTCMHLFSWP